MRKLTVLAKPGYAAAHIDPGNRILYDHLKALDVEVREWTPLRMLLLHYDILHVHWPDNILARKSSLRTLLSMSILFATLDFIRLCGKRVVWTMHNIESHEKLHPRLESAFWPRLAKRVDGFICPSKRLWGWATKSLPNLANKRYRIAPLGPFMTAYPSVMSRKESRVWLGIPENAEVILFIGKIRPYKNVEGLIKAFTALVGSSRQLVIAGLPATDELRRKIEELSSLDPRIALNLSFLSNEHMVGYISACDLVALPFLGVSNSGSALLALSFNRPILVPDRDALSDLFDEFGRDWVKIYLNDLSSTDLDDALRWATHMDRNAIDWTHHSWSSIAQATLELYRDVMAGPNPSRSARVLQGI